MVMDLSRNRRAVSLSIMMPFFNSIWFEDHSQFVAEPPAVGLQLPLEHYPHWKLNFVHNLFPDGQ